MRPCVLLFLLLSACDNVTCGIGARTQVTQTDLLAIELQGSTSAAAVWTFEVELPSATEQCQVTVPITGDPTCTEGMVAVVQDGRVTGLTVLHSGLIDPLDVTVTVRRDGTVLAISTQAPAEVVDTNDGCPITEATLSWFLSVTLPA